MQQGFIYIGGMKAKESIEGGFNRMDAFCLSVYIKSLFGTSACKSWQLPMIYDHLGIGRVRRKRLLGDIVASGYGEVQKNGTIRIFGIKNYYRNNIKVDRGYISSCSSLRQIRYIVRECVTLNHIQRQNEITYWKKRKQEPMNLAELKAAQRKLRHSVESDTVFDGLSYYGISRLLRTNRETAIHIVKGLEKRGLLGIERGHAERVKDNGGNFVIVKNWAEKSMFGHLPGESIFIHKNYLYVSTSNKYSITKEDSIVRLRKKNRNRKHNNYHPYITNTINGNTSNIYTTTSI